MKISFQKIAFFCKSAKLSTVAIVRVYKCNIKGAL